MNLTQLNRKQHGKIVRIIGPEPLRQRLVALGVLRGLPVRLSASTPWGNPRAYYIDRQQICLRNEDAACIEIEMQADR